MAQGRAGLSLFSGNADGLSWFVHEAYEDIFSIPRDDKEGIQGMSSVQGMRPCDTS